jgi:RHS repeat-associated protein
MVALNKHFAPENPHTVEENRIGIFFGESTKSSRSNRLSAQEPRLKKAYGYDETASGMFFYGFRYYDPETGRWPNRDPSGETFSRNLYGFTDNNTINYVDVLRLAPFSPSSFSVRSNYYQGGGSTQTYNQGAMEEFSDAVDNTLNFAGEQFAGEIESALMDLSGITNQLLKMGLSELLNPTAMGNDRRTECTLADSDSSACPKDSSDCVFGPNR